MEVKKEDRSKTAFHFIKDNFSKSNALRINKRTFLRHSINEFGVQWPFLDPLSTADLVVIIIVITAYGWCFNGEDLKA